MADWTRHKLEILSMFEVRAIAREIGVKAPTVANKDIIIDGIMDIVEGRVDPYIKKTKKGRPAKRIGSTIEILDLFLPAVRKAKELDSIDKKFLKVSTNIGENTEVKSYTDYGFLDILTEGYGYIRKRFIPNRDDDPFVPENLIVDFKLRKGDYLKFVERDVIGSRIRIITDILEVNNFKDTTDRPDFDKFNSIYPESTFKFKDNSLKLFNDYLVIGKGQRMAVFSDSAKLVNRHLIRMFESIDCKNKQFIYFNAQPEEKSYLTEKNIIHFLDFPETDLQLRAIEIIIENAKRQAEQKEDSVIFINNLTSVLNLYSENQTLTPVIDTPSITKLNALILNCKNTAEGGSITIICGVDLRDDRSKLMAPLLRSSINYSITLSDNLNFMNLFPCVDFSKQELDRTDKLLDDEHYNKLRETIVKNLDNFPKVIEELTK